MAACVFPGGAPACVAMATWRRRKNRLLRARDIASRQCRDVSRAQRAGKVHARESRAGNDGGCEDSIAQAEAALDEAFELVKGGALGLAFVAPQDPALVVDEDEGGHVIHAELSTHRARRRTAQQLAIADLHVLTHA